MTQYGMAVSMTIKAVLAGGGREVCTGVYLIEAGTEAIGHVTADIRDVH